VIEDVWDEGYSHHITRLMVLSNLATLLDISPRELTDWFWVAYIDAFDWVVEPNVLGMGTYAVGPVMTTKPYVSGSSYLHKMGDYCKTCAFDPKKDCPIKTMYWSFLSRHEDRFQGNIRMAMPMRSLKKRAEAAKWADARIFEGVQRRLAAGEAVTPADVKRWDAEARRDHDATVLETS
jgi:deoxyribodipyrimidine photolyase-related protein